MLMAMMMPATMNNFSAVVFLRLKKLALLFLGAFGAGLRRLVRFACAAIVLSLKTRWREYTTNKTAVWENKKIYI